MKNLALKCMLKCGHSVIWRGVFPHLVIDETLPCSYCSDKLDGIPVRTRVHAIECREWHVRCQNCRYSRWFGASEADATRAMGRHCETRPDHVVGVRYQLHPDMFQFVKEQLGKKVLKKIEGIPVERVVIKYKTVEEECPF